MSYLIEWRGSKRLLTFYTNAITHAKGEGQIKRTLHAAANAAGINSADYNVFLGVVKQKYSGMRAAVEAAVSAADSDPGYIARLIKQLKGDG